MLVMDTMIMSPHPIKLVFRVHKVSSELRR